MDKNQLSTPALEQASQPSRPINNLTKLAEKIAEEELKECLQKVVKIIGQSNQKSIVEFLSQGILSQAEPQLRLIARRIDKSPEAILKSWIEWRLVNTKSEPKAKKTRKSKAGKVEEVPAVDDTSKNS